MSGVSTSTMITILAISGILIVTLGILVLYANSMIEKHKRNARDLRAEIDDYRRRNQDYQIIHTRLQTDLSRAHDAEETYCKRINELGEEVEELKATAHLVNVHRISLNKKLIRQGESELGFWRRIRELIDIERIEIDKLKEEDSPSDTDSSPTVSNPGHHTWSN